MASRLTPKGTLVPWLLALPVAAAHLWLGDLWQQAQREREQAPPSRLRVEFVRELQQAAPPTPAALAPQRAVRDRARPAAPAAAAAAPAAVAAASAPASATADESDGATSAASAAASAASAPAETPVAPEAAAAERPAASASTALQAPLAAGAAPEAAPALSSSAGAMADFVWPPSTRLSYVLTGHYQGPVEGQASVEWRLVGERYQVEVEVGIGPFFAPIVSRVSLSDGLVTADGLSPRRYDEVTHVAFRAPRRLSLLLGTERVRLAGGHEQGRPPGLQDTASQFVQMTWLFATQRARLRAGETIRFPLALPRRVADWTYEVVGEQELHTPIGAIATWHVRPRPPEPPERPGAVLLVEFWVAPTLQYLPVRVVIRQDDESFVDLVLRRAPQQADAAQPNAPR